MSSHNTPFTARFTKFQDNRGFVSWKCNYCGVRLKQPQYPKSHQCGGTRGRGRARGGSQSQVRTRSSSAANFQTPDGEEIIVHEEETPVEDSESSEVPSPFNDPSTTYTPAGIPPNMADMTPSQLMQQQIFMQQQFFQRQESFQQFMTTQQNQFLETLQRQQQTYAQKDENTNALLDMMKNHSLNSRRIPCPKWTKEESYKSFSSHLLQ